MSERYIFGVRIRFERFPALPMWVDGETFVYPPSCQLTIGKFWVTWVTRKFWMLMRHHLAIQLGSYSTSDALS
jgi:hypothetical protein